ncbi:MAG: response regulator [Candidatus Eremiobacteraeota bacterium]|nr:response regulator [Candidatus Eremiobacteraeota bacterium]
MTAAARARVLVVEHSAEAAAAMAAGLEAADLAIAATATTPAGALGLAKDSNPDVVSVSLELEDDGGVALIEELLRRRAVPVVAVSSLGVGGSDSLPFRALAAGAADLVVRPLSGGTAGQRAFFSHLRQRIVRLASGQRAHAALRVMQAGGPSLHGRVDCVVVGSSTGGPAALVALLNGLGADFKPPVIVVQHIATPFIEGLIHWLNNEAPLQVSLAADGLLPKRNHVYIAPCGTDIVFSAGGLLHLQPPAHRRRAIAPSADALFQSAAARFRSRCAGVLLTGMGRDGAAGLLALRTGGARTFGQDEASCTVFGMPAAAGRLGAVEAFAEPKNIGLALRNLATS